MNRQLKIALMESSLPAYQIAQRIGISDSALSRIVCGRRVATPQERQRLAKLLGHREDELFQESSAPNRSVR